MVFDDVGVTRGVGSAVFCANGVEVEVLGAFDGGAFDGVDDGIGAGRDATVAYESWAGGAGRGEDGGDGLGGAFEGDRGTAAAACLVGIVRAGLAKMRMWCFCIIRSSNVSAKRQSRVWRLMRSSWLRSVSASSFCSGTAGA